jgi:hypothetical protein
VLNPVYAALRFGSFQPGRMKWQELLRILQKPYVERDLV